MADGGDGFDLFVSYAREDDLDGWVSALIAEVREEHRREFSPRLLRVFPDSAEAVDREDWEGRIWPALRHSSVLLVVMSPAYFASDGCRREWETFAGQEAEMALVGEGIAPIYAVEVPGFEAGPDVDAWRADLLRRQHCDVRPWRAGGKDALRDAEVRRRVESLGQQVRARLERVERHAASPTRIPPHNPNFVGRIGELRRLRDALSVGRVGAIAAVQGLGGIGKSALAFEYAHVFSDLYPGGRWFVESAGLADLPTALQRVGAQMGIESTDAERRDPDLAASRVRGELERRPPSLLLLDNVDAPSLLALTARARWLPTGNHVHVLLTTRLERRAFADAEVLALDVLPDTDALRLLARYRAFDEAATDDAERLAAHAIVTRLAGHALALEVVGVYLWQTPEVTYAGYLERLEAEGVAAVEGAAGEEGVVLSRHDEKFLGKLLAPTLDALAPAERTAVEFAAVLPPDTVVLPWVRELVAKEHPEVGAAPRPGHPDPWKRIEQRLSGLRLLVAERDPRVARVHRLVQDVVRARLGARLADRTLTAVAHALDRAKTLGVAWASPEARWELAPAVAAARAWLEAGICAATEVASEIYAPLEALGHLSVGRDLLRQAVALNDRLRAPDDPERSATLSNLAVAEYRMGNLVIGRDLLRRAIDLDERVKPPDGVDFATNCSNLAVFEVGLGNWASARELMRRSIAIEERVYPPDSPELATSYANLSVVEHDLGNLAEASALIHRAIAIGEKAHGPDHPSLLTYHSNLSLVERDEGNLLAARDRLHRVLEVGKRALGADHWALATCHSHLSSVEQDLGNLLEARISASRSMEISERVYPPDHPQTAKSYFTMASVELELGNLEAAFALVQRVLRIELKLYAPDHPIIAKRYRLLAKVESARGNLSRAKELLSQTMAIQERVHVQDHPALAATHSQLARVEWDAGNHTAALISMRRAVAIWRTRFGDGHRATLDCVAWLRTHDPDFESTGSREHQGPVPAKE